MVETSKYDKKKLIILRAVLIAVGAAVGGTAVWQYFVYYPDVMKRELQIVIIVVSAVVLATILGLSAKPFYRLGASIGAQFESLVSSLGARGVVAVVSGFVAACMIGFLFDVIIRDYLQLIAVRVLADVLVVIVFAAICCFGFTKWIAAGEETEEPIFEHNGKIVGYLLGASCFSDDRVFTAVKVLYNVKASEATFRALWQKGDADALERFRLLTMSGAVDTVKCAKEFITAEEYAAVEADIAAEKRLIPIGLGDGIYNALAGAVDLAAFVPPSGDFISEYKAAVADKSGQKTAEDGCDESSDGATGGAIIIDK